MRRLGDIYPVSTPQKMWTCLFILIGFAITANLVGVMGSIAAERHKQRVKKERAQAKTRASAGLQGFADVEEGSEAKGLIETCCFCCYGSVLGVRRYTYKRYCQSNNTYFILTDTF